MSRFVFDTNVIISALLFNDSVPGRALIRAPQHATILAPWRLSVGSWIGTEVKEMIKGPRICEEAPDIHPRASGQGVFIGGERDKRDGVPPGWSQARICEIAPLQRGFDLPTSQLRPGPHPVVYSNGVLRHHKRAMAKGPGVVTGRSGTIGQVHFIDKDYWPHNTTLWVTSFHGNDPKFVYFLYTHLNFAQFLSGSGVPTLNRNDVHQFLVTHPLAPEQRAIAEALSDVDNLLGSLEKLIAKKRAIKQAAMQKLLTGKTRLPGFRRQWRIVRLGELGSFSKGRGIRRGDVSETGMPCIVYGELYTRYRDYILHPVLQIPFDVALKALPVKKGDPAP